MSSASNVAGLKLLVCLLNTYQAVKFTASLHLKFLFYNPFRDCVCACEMLSNMCINGPLIPLFGKTCFAWLSQGGIRVLRWWFKWQSSIASVLHEAAVFHVWEEEARMKKGELIGMRPICTGFARVALISFKNLKTYFERLDIRIHKSTHNCYFLWRNLLVQNYCPELIGAPCRAVPLHC